MSVVHISSLGSIGHQMSFRSYIPLFGYVVLASVRTSSRSRTKVRRPKAADVLLFASCHNRKKRESVVIQDRL